MIKRSEGIRRIVLLISVLFVIAWIFWVGVVSDGFTEIHNYEWLIFIAGLVFASVIPSIISKITYWVIEGFKKDKEK